MPCAACARDTSNRVCMLNRRIVALGPPDETLVPLNIAVAFGDVSALHMHGDSAHLHPHPPEKVESGISA